MAMVSYLCCDCGEFWHEGDGEYCPSCGSKNIDVNDDEYSPFGDYELSDEESENENGASI